MNTGKSFDIHEVINFSEEEVIVKEYDGFDIVEPDGNGHFVVTNKRLIFLVSGKSKDSKSISITEWYINDIKGIKSEYGKRKSKRQTSLASIILVIGLGLLAVALFYLIGKDKFNLPFGLSGIFLLILGIVLMFTSKRKMFFLSIFTSNFMDIVTISSSLFQSVTLGKIKISPNKNTNAMIKELGAVIIKAKGK